MGLVQLLVNLVGERLVLFPGWPGPATFLGMVRTFWMLGLLPALMFVTALVGAAYFLFVPRPRDAPDTEPTRAGHADPLQFATSPDDRSLGWFLPVMAAIIAVLWLISVRDLIDFMLFLREPEDGSDPMAWATVLSDGYTIASGELLAAQAVAVVGILRRQRWAVVLSIALTLIGIPAGALYLGLYFPPAPFFGLLSSGVLASLWCWAIWQRRLAFAQSSTP